MKFILSAITGLMALTGAVHGVAQTPPPAPVSAPAAGPYTTATTTIDTLLADAMAKAILEKHFPGLTTNAQIKMAGGMTLKDLQQFAAEMFTDKALAETDADLAKLPPK